MNCYGLHDYIMMGHRERLGEIVLAPIEGRIGLCPVATPPPESVYGFSQVYVIDVLGPHDQPHMAGYGIYLRPDIKVFA